MRKLLIVMFLVLSAQVASGMPYAEPIEKSFSEIISYISDNMLTPQLTGNFVAGEKEELSGKTITLLSISPNAVRVRVKDNEKEETGVIEKYSTKEINGVSISVLNILSVSGSAGKSYADLGITVEDIKDSSKLAIVKSYSSPLIAKSNTAVSGYPKGETIRATPNKIIIIDKISPKQSYTSQILNYIFQ